jgi:hypothetical protein
MIIELTNKLPDVRREFTDTPLRGAIRVPVTGSDGDPEIHYTTKEFLLERELYKLYGLAISSNPDEAKKAFDMVISLWYSMPR